MYRTAVVYGSLPRNEEVGQKMNLSRNKNQKWGKYLGGVAREVDGLIIYSGNLNQFRQQICAFSEKWKNHIRDISGAENERGEDWEKVKNNPAWQDKKAGPPQEGQEWDKDYLYYAGHGIGPLYEMPAKYAPELMAAIEKYIERNEIEIQKYVPASAEYQNLRQTITEQKQNMVEIQDQIEKLNDDQRNKAWIKVPPDLDKRPPNRVYFHLLWWRYLNLNEEAVFGCWRPPLKKIRPDPRCMLIPEKGKLSLPPAENQEQEYERYYVVLTSIHDNMLTGVQSISMGIWPKELADTVWFRLTDGQPYGPDMPFIEVALERVKVDLAEKDEAERESQQGKFGFHPKKPNE
jgi:hypothetical protein